VEVQILVGFPVTVQGGYGFSGFQPSLRPRIGKNQAQLGPSRLFQELKPLFSRDPLNAYDFQALCRAQNPLNLVVMRLKFLVETSLSVRLTLDLDGYEKFGFT
jgi:hypothetical protein